MGNTGVEKVIVRGSETYTDVGNTGSRNWNFVYYGVLYGFVSYGVLDSGTCTFAHYGVHASWGIRAFAHDGVPVCVLWGTCAVVRYWPCHRSAACSAPTLRGALDYIVVNRLTCRWAMFLSHSTLFVVHRAAAPRTPYRLAFGGALRGSAPGLPDGRPCSFRIRYRLW